MKPWQGIGAERRLALALALALAAAVWSLLIASTAIAAESAWPTAQAKAINAEWVPYLDPPEKPAAICLVDSGVDITPDTPPDSPTGPIVKRLSLDGGAGTQANSTWEGLHGTRMALVGAAPLNGWGAAGVWPGARIISIRAMSPDQTAFPFENYSRALTLCTKSAAELNIVAVNLSLGCDCRPSDVDSARLDDRIVAAHLNGESVVAAAGNSSRALGSPANQSGVFAVAAGNTSGALCSFSNRGAGIDLIAPGCGIDLADPISAQLWSDYEGGTSGASIIASMTLALLRSYRPDLDWRAAEALTAGSSRSSADGAVLDVEAIFRAAGLGELVKTAMARALRTAVSPGSTRTRETPGSSDVSGTRAPLDVGGISLDHVGSAFPQRLPGPRLTKIARRQHHIAISIGNRPPGVRSVALLQSRRSDFGYATVVRRARSASRMILRLPRTWRGGRLVVRFERATRPRRVSRSVYRVVRR